MNTSLLVTAVSAMGGLTVILSLVLVVANKKLAVVEDPRIDDVEEMLPSANCGACGYPGCRSFAEAVVKGEANVAKCSVSSADGLSAIGNYLGVSVDATVKRVARLACAGGSNVAKNISQYKGLTSCRAAALVAGGGKACSWGCLGLADCQDVCDFDAITMSPFGLPIVSEEACTACGACVEICPKDLFSLQNIDDRLWVACSSKANGDEVLEACAVGCTACGRCAKDAPGNLITMQNNLPVIDYTQSGQSQTIIQRCPTGAIGWLHSNSHLEKGAAAPKIYRTTALPLDV
jgi:RnfABCDGE-type electron transport complex B subunit